MDKIHLNIKDPFDSKYQLLTNEREKVRIKKFKHSKVFTDYSQTTDNVYENLKDHNSIIKRKVSVWWYDSRHGS